MKRKWLNNLKAMGKGSSPSLLVSRDKRLLLNKIVVALSETGLNPPPLSQMEISRIEAKIFEQAFGETPTPNRADSGDDTGSGFGGTRPKVEGPVSAEVFRGRGVLQLTGDFAPQGTLATLSSQTIRLDDPSLDDPFSDDRLDEATRREPFKVLARPRRRTVKLVAITLGASYLVTAGMAAASQDARAGDALYPVKLQIEAIRIAFAGSDADKARTYIEIAWDRLGSLRSEGSMEPGDISITAGEMDGAGLHALRLSQRTSGETQTGLLGDVLALANQEQRVLEAMLSQPSQPAVQSLSQSYEVARKIELTALRLLLPTGTLPEAIAGEITNSPDTAGSQRSKTSVRSAVARDRAPASTIDSLPEGAISPDAEEPEPEPDPGCTTGSGEICIILPIQPIQLPGGLPQ